VVLTERRAEEKLCGNPVATPAAQPARGLACAVAFVLAVVALVIAAGVGQLLAAGAGPDPPTSSTPSSRER
jgi:hypothetical protein